MPLIPISRYFSTKLTVRRAHTSDVNADTDVAATLALATRMAATGGMAVARTTTWGAIAAKQQLAVSLSQHVSERDGLGLLSPSHLRRLGFCVFPQVHFRVIWTRKSKDKKLAS